MIFEFQALRAETMGAFNAGFETVNLHRPAFGVDPGSFDLM